MIADRLVKLGVSLQDAGSAFAALGRAMRDLDPLFRALAKEIYITEHSWRWHNGGVYAGRDMVSDHDYCVLVMLWPRENCPEGEYSHYFTVEVSWNFAPTIVWLRDGDDFVRPPFYRSEMWTGRQWRVWSWNWPHSFSITRIARPL